MTTEATTPGAVPLDGAVRALDPERADFEAWCCRRWAGDRNALGRYADDHPKHPGEYTMGNVEFAWQARQAAGAWINTSERKPRGGQLIVKRWKHGAVWAGTHDEGPKNESFHEWKAL